MESAIWEYTLLLTDSTVLDIPVASNILHVAEQHGQVTLWVRVDPTADKVKRVFVIVGTGNPFESEGLQYIGTVFDRSFVWHVHERTP